MTEWLLHSYLPWYALSRLVVFLSVCGYILICGMMGKEEEMIEDAKKNWRSNQWIVITILLPLFGDLVILFAAAFLLSFGLG